MNILTATEKSILLDKELRKIIEYNFKNSDFQNTLIKFGIICEDLDSDESYLKLLFEVKGLRYDHKYIDEKTGEVKIHPSYIYLIESLVGVRNAVKFMTFVLGDEYGT